MFQTRKLAAGVQLHVHQTAQFKTINLSIRFKGKLTEQKAAARSVLANILQHSNAKYPSQMAFRIALDDLYGTSMYIDSAKRGNGHVMNLHAETVNDQYLSEKRVLDQVFAIMQAALLEPNLEQGLFKETIFNREKNNVKQRLESLIDDKTRYAQHRMLELALPGHPASIPSNGTIEEVENLTNQLVMDEYRSMLEENEVEIYIVGDVDPEEMAAKVQQYFPFEGREIPGKMPALVLTKPAQSRVLETAEMKQGKLHMAFYTPVTFRDAQFPVMQVMNGVLGGYAHSKLFTNIREKESMAYYVSSSYASHFGLMFVLAGIDQEMEQKAVKLVLEQLDSVKAGDISDTEMMQTKALLINSLKESLDSARGQIELDDQYTEMAGGLEPERLIENWQNVTKEDVSEAAKLLSLEMTYFLSGKEGSDDE